ncbi:MAG TPA: hypothetical protein DDW52_04525 [Planctomycetaceae bacterium]|nr:hypothetical protein [Planctomycetaceae bacterium]
MRRTTATVLVGAALLGAGIAAPQKEPASDSNEVNTLATQRIALLQERVDYIELLIKHGLAVSTESIEPTLDLLTAKVDYAKSNDERRSIYSEMLKQYDRLIELAELDEQKGGRETRIKLRDDALYLKSERLKIRIARQSLDE